MYQPSPRKIRVRRVPSFVRFNVSSTPFTTHNSSCSGTPHCPPSPSDSPPQLAELLQQDSVTTHQVVNSLLNARRVAVSRARLQQHGVMIHTAATRVASSLQAVWAPSTLRQRQGLWQRFEAWLRFHGRTMTDHNATLFVETTAAEVQGKHQYAKTLMAVLNRMRIPTEMLSMYAAGLRAQGALVPQQQSAPISRSQLTAMMTQVAPRLQAAMALAWKTASRWDEIHNLQGCNFVLISPQEIIIDWARITKMTRSNPYRASKYTVVIGDLTATIAATIRGILPNESLTTVDAAQMERFLLQSLGPGYGAQSFKHGAMNVLAQAAANGLLETHLLALVAKHKMTTELSAMTVRYIQDRAAAARALGTSRATTLL